MSRSAATTRAPELQARSTIARPIPLPAPVTRMQLLARACAGPAREAVEKHRMDFVSSLDAYRCIAWEPGDCDLCIRENRTVRCTCRSMPDDSVVNDRDCRPTKWIVQSLSLSLDNNPWASAAASNPSISTTCCAAPAALAVAPAPIATCSWPKLPADAPPAWRAYSGPIEPELLPA